MKKLALLLLAASMILPNAQASFNDVGTDTLHRSGIEFLQELGMIQGNPDGTFAPERELNRAELAKLIIVGLGEEVIPKEPYELTCFQDIIPTEWYAGYLCKAKELGLVQGDDGEGMYYRPEDTVNLAEVLAVMSRVYDWPLPTDTTGQEWFEKYFTSAQDQGLLDTEYPASSKAARGHVADIMARLQVMLELGAPKYTGDAMYTEFREQYLSLTAVDCFPQEYFDEETAECILDCDTKEDCATKALLVEQQLEALGDDIYTEEGSTVVPTHTTADGELGYLARYDINDDILSNMQSGTVPKEYAKHNTQEKHFIMWKTFTALVPAPLRKDIVTYEVFTDGTGEVMGAVTPLDTNPSHWKLQMDLMDSFLEDGSINKKELVYTLIHEFAHVLTLRATQVAHTVAEEECMTYFIQEGCTRKDSYILAFYMTFWKDLMESHTQVTVQEGGVEQFYQEHSDAFITEYAATNLGEDIAESFTAFVLQAKPTATTAKDRKITFFYNYPELVAMREHMRREIGRK